MVNDKWLMMMNKYNPNIHQRRSIRLKGYDYSQAGLYFITICCENRSCLFGIVVDGEMIMNDAGKMADKCWMEIPNHFPNVVLHEYVIMPNHVHGIIELVGDTNVGAENVGAENVGAENFLPLPNTAQLNVGVENFQPLQRKQNKFQKMIPHSIGSIVKGYKIGVTKWMRQNTNIHNVWQRNYYEHIIRNEQSYQTISEYIINNPAKWADDKFYTQ